MLRKEAKKVQSKMTNSKGSPYRSSNGLNLRYILQRTASKDTTDRNLSDILIVELVKFRDFQSNFSSDLFLIFYARFEN